MTSPLDHVAELAARMAAAGIDALELRGPDGHVRLTRAGADRPETTDGDGPLPAVATGPEVETVGSPGVGRFLTAHPLRDEPLVEPDEPVTAGQLVGLLQVGTLLLPVTAPRDGTVAAILAEPGTLVGYGDPLLSVYPAS